MASDVSFHEQASAEYEAAFEWYYLRSEFAAASFAEEIARAISEISKAPKRWPETTPTVRKFSLRQFPFIVFYRELPGKIQILAVAHGRRKPGYWKARL